MKGRKALPTNLKVIRGTAQPCRMTDREPTPEKLVNPNPPALLSELAKHHWQTVVATMNSCGVLTQMDQDALVLYCELYGQWVECNEMIQKKGMIIADPRYMGKTTQDGKKVTVPMMSPYFYASLKLSDQMKKLLCEFGMTPSSRTRIRADNPTPEDEFDAWQKKRRMARDGV